MKFTNKEVSRLKKLLPELRAYYQLPNRVEITLVDSGFEHITARLRNNSTDYFLKNLYGVNEQYLQKINKIFQYLNEAKFPTCLPIKNKKKKLFTQIGNNNILLFPFLKIEEPEPTIQNITLIGRLLGKMHTTKFNKGLNRYKAVANLDYFFKEYSKLSQNGLSRHFSYLREIKKIPRDLPSGFIHSDLSFDNLLSTKNTVTGIIDFEGAGYGPYVLDVAEAIVQLCFDGKFSSLFKSFLKGYKTKRGLTKKEIEYFYESLLFGCMVRNIFWAKEKDSKIKMEKINRRIEIANEVVKIGKKKITDLVKQS